MVAKLLRIDTNDAAVTLGNEGLRLQQIRGMTNATGLDLRPAPYAVRACSRAPAVAASLLGLAALVPAALVPAAPGVLAGLCAHATTDVCKTLTSARLAINGARRSRDKDMWC